jgi:hypothetical protein
MALQIGATAPDFEAETTEGKIKFHDWIGSAWRCCSRTRRISPGLHHRLGALAKLKPNSTSAASS